MSIQSQTHYPEFYVNTVHLHSADPINIPFPEHFPAAQDNLPHPRYQFLCHVDIFQSHHVQFCLHSFLQFPYSYISLPILNILSASNHFYIFATAPKQCFLPAQLLYKKDIHMSPLDRHSLLFLYILIYHPQE